MKREIGEASAPCCPKSVVVRASLIRTGTESSSSLNKAAAWVGKKEKETSEQNHDELEKCAKWKSYKYRVYFAKGLLWSWSGLKTFPSPWQS